MRLLVQRSKNSSCVVEGKITGQIEYGLVVFVGFTDKDNLNTIEYLVRKLINLRIFNDSDNVMNKSILEMNGAGILSVSQFTLYADTKKGNRPSYQNALNSKDANNLYNLFNQELKKYVKVEEGIFGADMDINIINDGPVTILLERNEVNEK